MRILPRPLEHLELGPAGEQKTLPGAVEMIPELDRTGDEGPEHVLLDVLDTEQRGAAGPRLELPDSKVLT